MVTGCGPFRSSQHAGGGLLLALLLLLLLLVVLLGVEAVVGGAVEVQELSPVVRQEHGWRQAAGTSRVRV
jgi:hypothetical protein